MKVCKCFLVSVKEEKVPRQKSASIMKYSTIFLVTAVISANPCGFPPCYDGEINEQCESGIAFEHNNEKT